MLQITNPTDDRELEDLIFASKICKHTKSNTIVLVKKQTIMCQRYRANKSR